MTDENSFTPPTFLYFSVEENGGSPCLIRFTLIKHRAVLRHAISLNRHRDIGSPSLILRPTAAARARTLHLHKGLTIRERATALALAVPFCFSGFMNLYLCRYSAEGCPSTWAFVLGFHIFVQWHICNGENESFEVIFNREPQAGQTTDEQDIVGDGSRFFSWAFFGGMKL